MKVQVVAPDPQWALRFREEAARIRQALGASVFGVHHIGSTSVPGLWAKPIIDILLEVAGAEALGAIAPLMASIGYEGRGEFGIAGRRYFRKHDDAGVRTHHVHAFVRGDEHVARHLAFRDYLVAHPDVARAYGELKRRLAVEHPDSDTYVAAKDPFIREQQARALAWRHAPYSIRPATLDDVEAIVVIERDAAVLFDGADLPTSLEPELTREVVGRSIECGVCWIAELTGEGPVGFVVCTPVDDCLHVAEMDVLRAYGRRGIGTALLRHACAEAAARDARLMTLTTFAHVPWNAPFYAREGFVRLDDERDVPHLLHALGAERERGLANRVAMVKPVTQMGRMVDR